MAITKIFINMIIALSLTVVIELLVGFLLGIRKKEDILNIVIINCITNPTINYLMIVLTYFVSSNVITRIILFILEVIVVFSEYIYYKNKLVYKRMNLLLFSFILNLASFLTGVVMFGI